MNYPVSQESLTNALVDLMCSHRRLCVKLRECHVEPLAVEWDTRMEAAKLLDDAGIKEDGIRELLAKELGLLEEMRIANRRFGQIAGCEVLGRCESCIDLALKGAASTRAAIEKARRVT